MGCAGAVVSDINRLRELSIAPDAYIPSFAKMFTLVDRMFVNADTLASLQILRSELHPNTQTQGSDTLPSGVKENLSVFGLFKQFACTPQGKTKLRQMFLQPTIDLAVIGERQCAITHFALDENEGTIREAQYSLKQIKDMRKVIARLERGSNSTLFHASADHGLWRTLQNFSDHAVAVREGISKLSFPREGVPVIERVLGRVPPPLLKIPSLTDTTDRLLPGSMSKC